MQWLAAGYRQGQGSALGSQREASAFSTRGSANAERLRLVEKGVSPISDWRRVSRLVRVASPTGEATAMQRTQRKKKINVRLVRAYCAGRSRRSHRFSMEPLVRFGANAPVDEVD